MIVSALLTSVGINLAFSVLLFVLYSILRKQPHNRKIYSPRAAADGVNSSAEDSGIEILLPSPGWARAAWSASENDLYAAGGLDAVVFMRIFVFCLKIFCFAGAIGIFVLLPVNFMGDQLRDTDFSDITNKSLDVFGIANVHDGSKKLWIHFSAAYLITAFVCYLLYSEYKYIYNKRLTLFQTSRPLPQHFTVLVRNIPVGHHSSVDDTVQRFFTEFHPYTYLSHIVVRRPSKLRVTNVERLHRRITNQKSRPDASNNVNHGGFFGFGKKVDLVGDGAKKLEDVEENLRVEQSGISHMGKELPTAFVSFRSRFGAAAAARIQQSIDPTSWVTEQAPEPHDVFWPSFSASFIQRWISKLAVFVASVAMTLAFLIPVTFVQGLTNLEKLEASFPFLKSILSKAVVSQVITGYLPSLILHMFLAVVPPIMKLFSSMQGYTSHSEIEKSACSKMLLFTIWNIFFANVLTGQAVAIFLEPKKIPSALAAGVPAQATFFITYVVTSWTSLSAELVRLMPLLGDWTRSCLRCGDNNVDVPSITYHSEIPRILLFELLGLVYFLLAPLILPFILIFFCISYIVHRNQLLNVYKPMYETAGKFWPIVHNSTVFTLLVVQALAIGIFGLKKLPLASVLIVPLPILTLVLHGYCQERFLPIFIAYPTESLVIKDREEQNKPEMEEFFNNLGTAYLDPALVAVPRSLDTDDQKTPLLSSA